MKANAEWPNRSETDTPEMPVVVDRAMFPDRLAVTLTARPGNRVVRKAAAPRSPSLAGAAEQPDDFVTYAENATEANLRAVSR